MTRYLLDTGIMGHFINRRRGVDQRVREVRQNGGTIGTCVPVVGELFFGIEASQSREVNRSRLVRALSGIKCWPYTREAAEEYGRIAYLAEVLQSVQHAAYATYYARTMLASDEE